MSNDTHSNPTPAPRPAGMDTGSQALAEALRSSFAIIRIVMVVLVAVFLFSGFFTVGPQEKAIKLRFGRPVGEGEKALLGAGAHWAFPYPIDEVVKVPISKILAVDSSVGWYFLTPEQKVQDDLGTPPPPSASLNPLMDSYALTADQNILHVKATLNYRIEDPIRYVFGFVNPSNAVQSALDNALLATAARYTVDDILTRRRNEFLETVRQRVSRLVEEHDLGIVIDQCTVTPRPPRQLDDAFRNVLNAGQNRDKALNDARSVANQSLSKAEAEAAGRLDSAKAERTRFVQGVTSDADTFRQLLPKYAANPELFRQQRLLETMGRVLTNAQDKIFLAERSDGKPRELRLLLNRELPKRKSEPARP